MWVQVIGHLTYLFIACSYMLRDIVWLRFVAILASCTSIVFNFVAPETPLWLVINWNFIFLAVNGIELVRIWRSRRGRPMTDEEKRLAAKMFSSLTSNDAAQLMRLAQWKSIQAGQVLVRQGESVRSVVLVVEGTTQVARASLTDLGTTIERNAPTLVGELSFITGQQASATVTAKTRLRCVSWTFDSLHEIMALNRHAALVLQEMLCRDLSLKLRDQAGEVPGGLALETLA